MKVGVATKMSEPTPLRRPASNQRPDATRRRLSAAEATGRRRCRACHRKAGPARDEHPPHDAATHRSQDGEKQQDARHAPDPAGILQTEPPLTTHAPIKQQPTRHNNHNHNNNYHHATKRNSVSVSRGLIRYLLTVGSVPVDFVLVLPRLQRSSPCSALMLRSAAPLSPAR
jgi:hypothetical protein